MHTNTHTCAHKHTHMHVETHTHTHTHTHLHGESAPDCYDNALPSMVHGDRKWSLVYLQTQHTLHYITLHTTGIHVRVYMYMYIIYLHVHVYVHKQSCIVRKTLQCTKIKQKDRTYMYILTCNSLKYMQVTRTCTLQSKATSTCISSEIIISLPLSLLPSLPPSLPHLPLTSLT